MLELGVAALTSGRVSYQANSNGCPLFIELDHGAMLLLGDGASGEALLAAIELHRGQVRATAERLFHRGFWYADSVQIRMTISAADLG